MVRIRHAKLGIRLGGELRGHHEADDTGEVGLIGNDLQIEHQLDVLFKGRRDASQRPLHHRQLTVDIGLGSQDASLDVPNG